MALGAGGRGDTGHQEFQVVIDLGDRADGGTGRLDAVTLFDGNGGRYPFDGERLRLVHPIEELPRIGAESLDISPLSLGIDGVKSEAGFARSTRPGDDDQRSCGKV